jgi:integrase
MTDRLPNAKRDDAPRGVRRHPSGVWAIRYTCGAGHLHKEKVGPIKGDAIRAYHTRRARAHDEPGWCPAIERKQERARVDVERKREQRRVPFKVVAEDYMAWSKEHKRSWRTDASRIPVLVAAFGERRLDEVTPADVERFRDGLLETRGRATANRYRALLSAIYRRAIRQGAAEGNPVRVVPAFRENGERVTYLTPEEEQAVLAALTPAHRPLFVVSVNTGLRWSEQVGLRWRDVDVLTGFLTVPRSKHGQARRVPMNSAVRGVLMDLAAQRTTPDGPEEPVFPRVPTEPAHFFPKAVQRALAAMQDARRPAPHLDRYSWHGNRHTFASRLTMAGVDPRSVQELGGWKTFAMVARYAHLSPGHLSAAVERLTEVSRFWPEERSGSADVDRVAASPQNLSTRP